VTNKLDEVVFPVVKLDVKVWASGLGGLELSVTAVVIFIV
jgi:hypothetical protein